MKLFGAGLLLGLFAGSSVRWLRLPRPKPAQSRPQRHQFETDEIWWV